MRRIDMVGLGAILLLAGCSQPDAFTLYNNTGQDVRVVVENTLRARDSEKNVQVLVRAGESKELRESLLQWSVAPRLVVKAVFGHCTYSYDPLVLGEALRHYSAEHGSQIPIRLEPDGRIVKLARPEPQADSNGRIRRLTPRAERVLIARNVAAVQAGGFPIAPLERVCGQATRPTAERQA